MALKDILEQIDKEGKKNAGEILSSAQQSSEEILAHARKEAESIRQEFEKKAEASASQLRRREAVMGQLEARKKVLAEKERILEEVYRESLHRLRNIPVQEKRKILKRLILSSVETGDEKIIIGGEEKVMDQRFIREVEEELNWQKKAGALKWEKDPSLSGGFILQRGKVEVNHSWDNIFREVRERTIDQVTRILFED